MKALFIGLGSIGKRHIKDFVNVCNENGVEPEIYVLRRAIGELGDLEGIVKKQITEINNEDRFNVAFITNPTHVHYDALLKCNGKVDYYFIEKPIFDKVSCDVNVLDIDSNNSYIACPMRHTLTYNCLKQIVEANNVYSARIICSSYLPEWRKNVDYRKNYSAIREMGGGVSLDLIHEIDYLVDLFGFPEEIYSISGKYSNLEISSDDLSIYIMKFSHLLCEVHLDYFGRNSKRTCELYTNDGLFIADFINEKVIYPSGNELNCHVIENEEFINEMRYFYKFITGQEKTINSPEHAVSVLDLALGGKNIEQ